MENINYEDFLIKPKENWIKKSTTNVYCNLNVLPSIVSVLKKVGELKEFRRSCFRHVVDIPHDLTFSTGVLHNLLLRQIKVPDVTGVNELHFSVGGKLLKFTQREFCLVTGLQFGEMSNIFLQPYAPIEGGIHDRYFEKDENVCLIRVWEKFMTGKFDKPKDGLKMALLLIANMVLFGRDQRKKVTLWLFELVEDLESFNSFKWGSYVYIMTCHYLRQAFRAANGPMKVIANYNLYGFPWALEIWAMEALGSLIDLVGENIGHRHPRLRNWRIFKRPHDFFSKFEKYEQKVKDGQYVILAELHPSANESEEPYLVGVDTDLSIGPQFVPDKEEEDDGEPRVDDQGDNDDNHRGQSRPQQKDKPVKRKRSLPKQKTTARTKRQRTSGDTSPVGDDSAASSQTMKELVTEMSDRFEDIVKKQISAMERRINRRLTWLEDSVTKLIDARRQVTCSLFSFSTGM